jgi:hypothetical protein
MKKLFVMIATVAATQMSPAFAMERDVIARAQAAFDAQLALRCAADTRIDWLAEDAVYQYALTGIDVSLRMQGRGVVAEHLCAIAAVAPDAKVENVHYFPTLHPDIVYVQYDLVPADADAERSKPLAVIQMRDEKIASFTQLSKSPQSLQVLKAATGHFN